MFNFLMLMLGFMAPNCCSDPECCAACCDNCPDM